VAVARHGKLVHFRTLGRMDMARPEPMRGDAIFRLASMTKPITSVAVMMLLEEGHFQLQDPVSSYIPELAGMAPETEAASDTGPREMTIRDLLTHMAGLPATGEDPRHDQVWSDPELSLEEIMARIGQQPLAVAPGTEFIYGRATDILGYLVEVVSKQPFAEFLRGRIFEPLGMRDARFFVPQNDADRVPAVYAVNSEGVTELVRAVPRPDAFQPPNAPSGAGGLFSTVDDYIRFSQMMLNGGELDGVRLLSPKTVELMRIDHLPADVHLPEQIGRRYGLAGYGFGLGVRVRTNLAESQMLGSIGEYGWAGFFGTYFLIDPEEDLIAMFFPQLQGSEFYPIRRQFNNAVYQAIMR
jgi:CubicO group peptidase (beta-lactamase class C family)